MIGLRKVNFSYKKDEPVLKQVDWDVPQGITMLLGPNGCGKSTLLKLASGVEKPDSGCVTINGMDVWKREVEARKSLAYLPEQPDLTPYATVKEILYLVCRLRGEPFSAADRALDFFGLKHVASRTVRELSMGQRRRAVFSTLLIGKPENILLDEPLEGMDRNIQQDILRWISNQEKDGAFVVVVSQIMEPFVRMASAASVIKEGRLIFHNDLPENNEKRMVMLEALAKGESL